MEKLIKNAISQFMQFGQVRIIIYPNRSLNDYYDIIEYSINEAIDTISYYYNSTIDDIHVSHANAM